MCTFNSKYKPSTRRINMSACIWPRPVYYDKPLFYSHVFSWRRKTKHMDFTNNKDGKACARREPNNLVSFKWYGQLPVTWCQSSGTELKGATGEKHPRGRKRKQPNHCGGVKKKKKKKERTCRRALRAAEPWPRRSRAHWLHTDTNHSRR